MNFRHFVSSALLITALAACGDGGTGPADDSVAVAIQSGDAQFGVPGAALGSPLQVVVTDPVTRDPLENITITWAIVTGGGAAITPAQSVTNDQGVASASLQLGASLGDYEVEARAPRTFGDPPRFRARAVNAPVISGAPTQANVRDTITLVGQNFSPQADDNLVLFGGFRAKVVSATTTQLRVVVPSCVPARLVPVTAALGAVSGNVVTIDVQGSAVTALQLARGDVRTITDPAELGCFQLPAVPNYAVLLVPQNASDVAGTLLPIQLAGLSASGPVASARFSRGQPSTTVPLTFETGLRARERRMLEGAAGIQLRPQPSMSAAAACPSPASIGDRCTFQVINKDDDFVSVTAELKAISARALIYQDLNAPANGLATANFQALGSTFDDPIYSAVSTAFGNPSDMDGNSKIIILATPVVNALTPRSSSGFIAGFFYGCDLVARSVCQGSNGGEIFYTMVADPAGQFSDPRSIALVMASLPPVLGHEFQHMISFGQRHSSDALWLSEGLAHHAEDVVADVYAARGDATTARQFRLQNHTRANRYLRDPAFTSLIAEGGTGTLELRGAAWLFVKYLAGQHGQTILRTLSQSSQSSVTNVTQATGKPWSTLIANWSVALYADDAPELAGAAVRTEYTFPNINLRTAADLNYPLRPATEQFVDFMFSETLPASSEAYLKVQAGTNPGALSLTLAGLLGGAFPLNAAPQLSILRLQ
jgi:hypothetical protein